MRHQPLGWQMKCTCASVHIHDCAQNLKFWWQGRKVQPLASVLYDPSPNITKLFVLCIRFNCDLLPTYNEWVTEIGENLRPVCCVSICAFSFRTLTVNMNTNWGLMRIVAVFRRVLHTESFLGPCLNISWVLVKTFLTILWKLTNRSNMCGWFYYLVGTHCTEYRSKIGSVWQVCDFFTSKFRADNRSLVAKRVASQNKLWRLSGRKLCKVPSKSPKFLTSPQNRTLLCWSLAFVSDPS